MSSTLSWRPLFWACQPETEAEAGAGGEGTSAMKRGLSVDAAAAGQDVKRFRTATGAASAVSSISHHSKTRMWFIMMFQKSLNRMSCLFQLGENTMLQLTE